MHHTPPPEARKMHNKLEEAGLVDRIRAILMSAPNTEQVSQLLCWVVTVSSGSVQRHLIVAQFIRQERGLFHTSPRPHPYRDQAEFAVSTRLPFGPVLTARPLKAEQVQRVADIALNGR